MLLALRIVACLLVLGLPVLAADGPPAPPTTQQVVERTAQIQQWFNQLNDTRAEVRETARYELLGLNRSELTLLKSVVKSTKGIVPAQSSALHEIVLHVYLAGAPRVEGSTGFLGLSWSGVNPDVPAVRAIGCVAYRVLQDGDEIVGIPEANLSGDIDRQRLINTMRTFFPGQTIHLVVLRRGERKELRITLDAAPVGLSTLNDVNSPERLQPAEDVWKTEFVPLLEERTL